MLLSVLLLAAIGVGISATLLSLSISSAQTAATLEESAKARAVVNVCAEKALQLLIVTRTYTGSGSVRLENQSCTYAVNQFDATSNNIYATSTVGQTTRKLHVRIKIPELIVMSWKEI